MIKLFKPTLPPAHVSSVQRHVRMAMVLCQTFSEELTLVQINSRLTPVFDNASSKQKLCDAFDFFHQFAQRLVNMLPSEKRAEMESFISEFAEETEDADSAYYLVASIFILQMVHLESVLILRESYRAPKDLWESVDNAAKQLCETYLAATDEKYSSAPFIAPELFKKIGIDVYADA